MTRFATFWVQHGVIQAPVEVMRFDETIYRLLGDNLVGLTAEREMILDPGSYFQRSTDSARLPGVRSTTSPSRSDRCHCVSAVANESMAARASARPCV
jgi:hypothetical protein